MSYELLGHDCPTGAYPAPVVPVGLHDALLAVAYRSSKGVQYQFINENASFVRHAGGVSQALRAFDIERQSLFAFSATDVVAYATAREPEFLESVLRDVRRGEMDPFLRLCLAYATGYEDLIIRELVACVRALNQNIPSLLGDWYRQTLGESNTSASSWPADPTDLLSLDENALPGVARTMLLPLKRATRRLQAVGKRLMSLVAVGNDDGSSGELDTLVEESRQLRARVCVTGRSDRSAWRLFESLLHDPEDTASLMTLGSFANQSLVEAETAEQPWSPSGAGGVRLKSRSALCRLGLQLVFSAASARAGAWSQLGPDVLVYVMSADDADDDVRQWPEFGGTRNPALIVVRDLGMTETFDGERWPSRGYLSDSAIVVNLEHTGFSESAMGRYVQLQSGVAVVEEAVANICAAQVFVPAIRRIGTRSMQIGQEHGARLRVAAAEQVSKLQELAERRAYVEYSLVRLRQSAVSLADFGESAGWHGEFAALKRHSLATVTQLVSDWRLSASTLPALREELQEVIGQCTEALREELRACGSLLERRFREFLRAEADSGDVGPVFELRDTSARFEVGHPRPSWLALVYTMAAAPLGFTVGGLPSLLRTGMPPLSLIVDRQRTEAILKQRLLEGTDSERGLLESADLVLESAWTSGRRIMSELSKELGRQVDESLQEAYRQLETIAAGVQRVESERLRLAQSIAATLECVAELVAIVASVA